MLIDLSELLAFPDYSKDFPASCGLDAVLDFPVKSAEETVFRIERGSGNTFKVSGSGSVTLEMPCDRCLEPVEQQILFSTNCSFDLQSGLDSEGDECAFLSGKMLDTDELVLDEVILNLPVRVLCREDCAGLCERCGANLNYGPCQCGDVKAPTRMADAIMAAFMAAEEKK